MPIYDYRCDHCGHVFSAVQSFSDGALQKCPNCGKVPRRLISTPAIVFKGSGWYKTDSRPAQKADDTPAASADKAGADRASADKKTETKAQTKGGETRTDAKTETKPAKPPPKSEAAS